MTTSKRIAVAGATGRVGRHAVDLLRAEGHEVVEISRSNGVDVITGKGLAAALTGVDSVIDATTGPSPEEKAATEFFTTATRNLHEAGERAGVRRLVVVSIIGADRFTEGYGMAKIAHEQAALAGPVPARILRAAQFHELVEQLVDWGRHGDVSYVPKMRTQLVAARTVAEALAELATSPSPAVAGSGIPEIAGPREENLVDMAVMLASRRDLSVQIEEVSNPADPAAQAYESGGLLPGPEATLAGPTFEQWLEVAA
jgi:uncharacterized protein YbjT (DUF2867 family)